MTHFHALCTVRVGIVGGARTVLLQPAASRCDGVQCADAEDVAHPELVCWSDEDDAMDAARERMREVGTLLTQVLGAQYAELSRG